MTHDEALDLIVRLKGSWPEARWTPDIEDAWRDELVYLDAGPAGTTLVRLRRTEERRPSIAKFRDAYHALHTPSRDERIHCADCGGNGWVETSGKPPEVVPCRCGRVDRHAVAKARKENTTEPWSDGPAHRRLDVSEIRERRTRAERALAGATHLPDIDEQF